MMPLDINGEPWLCQPCRIHLYGVDKPFDQSAPASGLPVLPAHAVEQLFHLGWDVLASLLRFGRWKSLHARVYGESFECLILFFIKTLGCWFGSMTAGVNFVSMHVLLWLELYVSVARPEEIGV